MCVGYVYTREGGKMIEASNNEINLINERDKYKSYFYLSLMGIYVLITIMFFMYLDVHKLDKAYKQSQEDLATMTIKTLELQSIVTEINEDSRMIEELKNVKKENR